MRVHVNRACPDQPVDTCYKVEDICWRAPLRPVPNIRTKLTHCNLWQMCGLRNLSFFVADALSTMCQAFNVKVDAWVVNSVNECEVGLNWLQISFICTLCQQSVNGHGVHHTSSCLCTRLMKSTPCWMPRWECVRGEALASNAFPSCQKGACVWWQLQFEWSYKKT